MTARYVRFAVMNKPISQKTIITTLRSTKHSTRVLWRKARFLQHCGSCKSPHPHPWINKLLLIVEILNMLGRRIRIHDKIHTLRRCSDQAHCAEIGGNESGRHKSRTTPTYEMKTFHIPFKELHQLKTVLSSAGPPNPSRSAAGVSLPTSQLRFILFVAHPPPIPTPQTSTRNSPPRPPGA